ncbi:MAG: phosphopyruvate hydratase [Candidatus Micrarchaeota archaeon]|nr:phosphopyruvate hydratase [Candidatus Micrarchaeota archaeon]
MGKIVGVKARQVLDSRGNPTVQAEVLSEHGFGRASSPSGASTGRHEALELRDGGKKYGGKGVQKAVANVNGKIAKALVGKEVCRQSEIDSLLCLLDSSRNKAGLGANATTAVSIAAAQCAASEKGCGLYELLGQKPLLPAPMMNVLNGGKHAQGALAIQELMIFPLYFRTFSDALRAGVEIYHELGRLISKKYGKSATLIGDEGGFAPPCQSTAEALDLLEKAIENCGYQKRVRLAVDAAASSFYGKSGRYLLDKKSLSAQQLSDFYCSLCKSYPIVSLEDPFEEDSFEQFSELRRRLSGRVQIVGDDLLVTNTFRIQEAIRRESVSALLLKVNQVGTLSEALLAAALCRKSRLGVVVSHRSGETEDSAIADIAVGIGCGQIKAGAPARGERTVKYNRLLQIEEELPCGSFARDCGLAR